MGDKAQARPSGVGVPISVRSLVGRFALAGVVVLVLMSAVTAYASSRVGTDEAVKDAEQITRSGLRNVVEPALQDSLLDGDPAAIRALDQALESSDLDRLLVRVKLWAEDGTVVYSDERRLIGKRFELDPDHFELLSAPGGQAAVSDLGAPENVFEREGKLLEVYKATQTPNGTNLLFEAYFDDGTVSQAARHLWMRFAPIAIGSLVLLQLVQVPLAWSMARRLRADQPKQEELLRRAIDTPDAERRRLAGDLHDGVVQDLTGVSLRLAAVGRSPEVEREQVLEASGAIRSSIKSLRSLLVEIYPPNLQAEGLESAIGDLLQHLTARGVETTLDAELDGEDVPPAASAVLYRTAQEALRNVSSHAEAEHVAVALRRRNGSVEITIDDDGRGFPPERLAERGGDGHFGLRALADLVSGAGGSLGVDSSEGSGTRVVATVPVSVGEPA